MLATISMLTATLLLTTAEETRADAPTTGDRHATHAAAGGAAAPDGAWIGTRDRGVVGDLEEWPTQASTGLGACCTVDGCVPVEDEAACLALGGFYFPDETCESGWCDPGACCSEANCIEAGAFNCISGGRDYLGPDVSCADDPCAIGFGACCLGESCELLSDEECAAMGGTYLGPGTACGNDPCVLGSCCFEDGCFDGPRYECTAAGGMFVPGASCSELPCTEADACPENTLFGQSPDGPNDFIAGTSEDGAFIRAENFFAAGGAISEVHWWGFDLQFVGGNFVECVETDNSFRITFHEDAGGVPGAEVCSHVVEATRVPTGELYLNAELNEYSAALPEPCVLTNGWVSIVGLGDPDCWFIWLSAGLGESWCDFCVPSEQDFDLAVCLVGESGGVFGACCDDATGICLDDVEISDCLGPTQRFVPDGSCADLDPPCGVVLGACCFEDGTCERLTESECIAEGGAWLGANSICSSCPCVVPCPEGTIPEGEETCGPGYVDEFNGGCLADTFAVSAMNLGDTICGIGGVFKGTGGFIPDTDWYEVEVVRSTELVAQITAEFRPQLFIASADGGCPANAFAGAAALECDDLTVSATVEPGSYWIIVGPLGATDSAACGAAYTLRVFAGDGCTGDLTQDGLVDGSDLGVLLAAWATDDPAADLDGDGVVQGGDLGILLAAWGPCGP